MYSSSNPIKKKPNTGLNEFNPTQSQIQQQQPYQSQQPQQSQKDYKITPTYDLPFILTQAINDENQQQQIEQDLTGSLSSRDGTCFVIYSNELFIWTIDKPQYCDRIELPIEQQNITRQHIVVYKNKSASERFSVFLCSPMTGYIRFWGNSSKPNVSQDLPLESPGNNNNNFRIFITECQPFGVIVGNSLGSIYLVTVRNNNNLISKKINKSQGMLSYLYLSRQSPVISVFSSPINQYQQQQQQQQQTSTTSYSSSSVKSRFIYVLTEGSLLKYEIENGSERVVLDFPIQKEIQKHFTNLPKFHQMYIDTIIDQNKEEIQIVNFILYETSASQNLVKYYILQIEIQDDQVLRIKKLDRFSGNKKLGGGVVSIEPILQTNSLKYYLTWFDNIYYYSNSGINGGIVSGSISFQNGGIAFSGFYKNQFYFFSEQGIIKLDIQPFGSGQLAGSELHIQDTIKNIDSSDIMMDTDNSVSSSNTPSSTITNSTTSTIAVSPILFDIPKDENLIGSKRNNVLKLMNSFSLKQHTKVDQFVKICKGYNDLDQVIQQVSLWIIDQQPNSKFWADDGKLLHMFVKEISVQLNQQLEDKKKRHNFLLTCIKDTDLYKPLTSSTKEILKKNEIKIKCAIELRNYQNQQEQSRKSSSGTTKGSSSIFSQLIESLVAERNPNWTNIGMNVYELFYSNVSGIDQILINITSKLQESLQPPPQQQQQQQQQQQILTSANKAQILLENCELFYLISSSFPVEYLNSPIIQNTSISIHNLFPKVIQSVLSFIQSEFPNYHSNTIGLGVAGGSSSSTSSSSTILLKKDLGIPNIDKQLYDHLYRLTEKYLYSLKTNQFEQFNQFKTKLIEPFVEYGKFQEAITLANQFDDFFTLINVYCCQQKKQQGSLGVAITSTTTLIDSNKLLIDCLTKFEKIGQLSKVYEYMLEKNLKSELLQLPSDFNDSLFRFLQSNTELSWIHSIRMKNWTNVSNILYQKSVSNQHQQQQQSIMTLKEKQKLLSLSKVSLMVSGATSSSSSTLELQLQPSQQIQLDVINQNLSLIKSQKFFLPEYKNVLSVSEVIQLILQREIGDEDPMINFVSCVEIISESPLLLKKEEVRELLKLILELSIINETVFFEKSISDIQLSYSLKETKFFNLISHPRFPKEISLILLEPIIEDYYKSHINSDRFSSPDNKRQFEISVTRLLELSKFEIGQK
ncbi:hypothetical protein RB653_008095 [Dictyostelium firmibasis]|uniref:Nucleoporin Nup133/Nup155-like N-terminal domain-containing protein n=1 Tax=Dictyostelium firmibasis TaxID=79012 RepID=A0AAN7TS26_9MYCE